MPVNRKNLFPPLELLLVGAAVKTGIFDALKDGPAGEGELAARTGCDARSLWTVIEALVEAGYLERPNGKVQITEEAREMFFDGESPNYTGYSFMHGYQLCSSWLSLPEVIKDGKPVKRSRTGEELRGFILSMALHARKEAPLIARDSLEGLQGGSAVLDVGGGPLTYAREFANLGCHVTVLDLPEVVEMMIPKIRGQSGIAMVPGDMTVSLPEGPFDLVYLGNVCHIFDEEENKKIFSRAFGVLNPGGRVVIQDFVRGISPRAAMFGVNMLVNTEGGGTWTMEQYGDWLENAGFKGIEIMDYGDRQLIKAHK